MIIKISEVREMAADEIVGHKWHDIVEMGRDWVLPGGIKKEEVLAIGHLAQYGEGLCYYASVDACMAIGLTCSDADEVIGKNNLVGVYMAPSNYWAEREEINTKAARERLDGVLQKEAAIHSRR